MGGYEYAPESRLLARATRMPNALEGGNALCPVRRNMPSFSATRSATASMVRWPMLIAPLCGTLGMRSACRSEEHTSELQSLMRISYAVFCLKKKNTTQTNIYMRGKNEQT